MKKLVLTFALGTACLGLAACGDSDTNAADAANAAGTEAPANGSATQSASAAFPTGARIVEENGVTYRVDADGTRVRIDDDGVAIDVDLPDLDIGINEKGNPDVDVGDRDPDGGR